MALLDAKEDSETLVVRVEGGTSDTKVRRFRSGNPVATLTVGTQGAWKVEAPGVASVHAYLRFDGRQLLAATSDPRRPVVIDGRSAPETWSLLHPPCVLRLGQASLCVERDLAGATPPVHVQAASSRSTDDQDELTCRRSVPMPLSSPQVGAEHDDPAHGDALLGEPTRLQFGLLELPDEAAFVESPDHVGTRALQVSSLPPTLLDQPPTGVEGELGSVESPTPPPFGHERRLRVRRLLQRGGLVLGLVVVVGGAYRVANPRGDSPLGSSASRSEEPSTAHLAPLASSPPAVAATPPLVAIPPLFVPEPQPGPIGLATGARMTAERRAVDAFAAGDFAMALRLYRELAAAHPEQPAFRQAVRILEEKK
ncbi:MAG TPA: hypothetical protein VK550_05460 [Polyangiaceae bacterium]|nr:hypothetical protein [Polyangiaceae bacterium]